MDRSANVSSIDAVRALRAALVKFEAHGQDALTLLDLEVRRAVAWVEQDRRRYWPAQVKKASEALVEARNELERCQLRYGQGEAPACYDQKKRYEQAKRRLRYCEEKVRLVKNWTQTIHHELNEFEGQTAQMAQYLEADIPRALTALARMICALEKYAGERRVAEGNLQTNVTPMDVNQKPSDLNTSPPENLATDGTRDSTT